MEKGQTKDLLKRSTSSPIWNRKNDVSSEFSGMLVIFK
jgi:hypothetical protein